MIRKLFAVLAAVVAAVALLATPATASPVVTYTGAAEVTPAHYGHCPAARFCIFAGLNGGHPYAYFRLGDGNLGDSVGPVGMNNTTESVWNRTNQWWCLYDSPGFQGLIGLTPPNGPGHNLETIRNRVSSLRPAPC